MMGGALTLSYSARNLVARRLTTTLTVIGMALVVFVFATVLMMAEGLRRTMGGTGSDDNVVVVRQGAQTEVQSTLTLQQAGLLATMPGVATDNGGQPKISREVLVLINLPRKDGKGLANVVVRGTSLQGIGLRPQAHLTAGRAFRPGSSELIVGSGMAGGRFGLRLGEDVRFGMRDWTVVGTFEAGNSGFDSEIWGDAGQMMQAFRRDAYSSVLVGMRDGEAFAPFFEEVAHQPRLKVDLKRERAFYADQSKNMANFISILGHSITVIFSIGAILGAMITMYASVANRTREIGTLRALGFKRGNIIGSFLQEALLLGLFAGAAGLAAAVPMQALTISTTNVQTFSEVVFGLVLTPAIVVEVILFALVMGVLGGVLPALKASRLEIIDALRAA